MARHGRGHLSGMNHPVCLLLPLAYNREITVCPEFPGFRVAMRRHDGASVRYEGGFVLTAPEIAELRTVLATITSEAA